jgi:hypothetical protein
MARLIAEPFDPVRFSRAGDLVVMTVFPELEANVLLPAGCKILEDAVKDPAPDFERLARVAAVAEVLAGRLRPVSLESMKPLVPFLDNCAEAAIKAEDLEKLALVTHVSSRLRLQSSISTITRVGAAKVVRAAVGKPLKSGSVESILNLVAGYHIEDGVKLAVQAAKQKNLGGAERGYALVWLPSHGGKDQVALFESLLDDKTSCAELTFRDYAKRTELRDVALAVLITLGKEDPEDFGYSFQMESGTSIDQGRVPLEYLGFGDEVCRQAAFKMWNERRKTKK